MGRLRSIYICCFILIRAITVFAFSDTTLLLLPEKKIPGSYTNFYVDNLNNIFLINADNRIKKLNNKYDSVAVFNDTRRYGNIYLLDVNNPLKILVYYKDFSTIVLLDRFLNIRNTIDLRRSGILQAKAVAQSYDNNYWVFDELENKLKKLDDNGNILLQTADFRILFSDEFLPSRIIDYEGMLYLYDEKTGWMLFDYYGAFKQKIKAKNRKDVNVTANFLTGRDDNYIYFDNIKTFASGKFNLSINVANALKAQRQNDKAFILQKDGLVIYKIQ